MDEEKPQENQTSAFLSVENFASKHLELLELERDAEVEENKCLKECSSLKSLQKRGVCIPKLCVSKFSTGLFGRSLISFETFWKSGSLPSHTITSGDIVGVGNISSDGKIEIIASGVITRVSDTFVSVAFEKNSDFPDLESDTQYAIIKLANDVTYKRLKRVLKALHLKSREFPLIDVLFGDKNLSTWEELNLSNLCFYNDKLNEEQKESVKFALSQKEVAIIHGPPGTGKTTTVVECILQTIAQKLKVIACAPSNVAVDNLVEKLASHKVKMVRLGHPARFLTSIQQYSLDAIISNYDGSNVVDELHKEIDELREKIRKTKGSYNRKSLWAENRFLLKEVKEREKFIVQQVLKNADVVLCTLTSGSDDGPLKYIDKEHFDVCFIDECSQAIEAACWIPLQLVKKCVLAGDHNQLPPTIISKKAAEKGLELTLMERLLKLHGESIKKMLTTQYRMNEIIMKWPSQQLYENKLIAHENVKSHVLADLDEVESNDDTTSPLVMIDTVGCGLQELNSEDDESKGNEGEADLVAMHVKNLIEAGISPSDIAVITPYNLQVELVKSRLSGKYPKLEIKSVDGFQGREKEAIVLSLVRSNDVGEVGFLVEDRRINVAITRAKRHLAVICDSKTVSYHGFLKSFVDYCEEKGEVRTAFQFESEIGNYPTKKRSSSPKEGKKGLTKNVKKEERSNDGSKVIKKQQFISSGNGDKKKVFLRSEEEQRFTEERYEKVIKDFMKSPKLSITLPATLSAFERRAVHEVAEKLGLLHVSAGEGVDRYIEVKKPAKQVLPLINTNNTSRNTIITNKEQSLPNQPSKSLEEKNEEQLVTIVEDINEPNDVEPTPQIKSQNGPSTKKKTSKTKSKPSRLTEKTKPENDEDFDSLIEQAIKADRTCTFAGCKKCIATLVQVCQYCRKRFCFSHFIPEVHGCGAAAKAHARSQIRKDGVLYAGSGRPEKKTDPIKHTYLQKKLDKKLGEFSDKRKTQKKDKS